MFMTTTHELIAAARAYEYAFDSVYGGPTGSGFWLVAQ